MKKALQLFSKDVLNQSKKLSPTQAADFLDQYQRLLAGKDSRTKLISLRVPENVLDLFKKKANLENIRYQQQIVRLMRKWLEE